MFPVEAVAALSNIQKSKSSVVLCRSGGPMAEGGAVPKRDDDVATQGPLLSLGLCVGRGGNRMISVITV